MRAFSWVVVAAVWLGLFGCGGSSHEGPADQDEVAVAQNQGDDDGLGTGTGNPENDGHGEPGFGGGVATGNGGLGGPLCNGGTERPVELEEETELGFSAADILAFAEGTHEENLRWNEQTLATYGPESGAGEITIRVEAVGAVRFLEPPTASDNGGLLGGPSCRGALEIDVEVQIETAGGALDESFEATLRSDNPLEAVAFARLEPETLGGAFEVLEVSLAGFSLAQLDLTLSFTPFGSSGALSATFERITADAAIGAAGGPPLAEWGAAYCQDQGGIAIGPEDEVDGLSASVLRGLFGAFPEVNLAWADGATSPASMAFAPEPQGACISLQPEIYGDEAISMTGDLTLQSEDGRVDARWPGTLRGTVDDDGALISAQFELSYQLPEPTVDNLASVYGFGDLDESEAEGYDALSVDVRVVAEGGAAPSLSGEVGVTGHTFADCAGPTNGTADPGAGGEDGADAQAPAPEPSPPQSGGTTPAGSSPGCAASTPTELRRATLSPVGPVDS